MILLLGCSAFFSGSETAFFNLSKRQLEIYRKSRHKLERLIGHIMENPSKLLSSLLLGNMVVNVLFFAVSSVFVIALGKNFSVTAATVTAVFNFTVLILFGEILPKSFSYTNSRSVSMIAAGPAYLCTKILTPAITVFHVLFEEPALRLMLGPGKRSKPITTAEFVSLIDEIRKQGLITPDENKLLTETIELGYLKVHHVMSPRVDMIAVSYTHLTLPTNREV